jgi:hypothetical protein
MSPAPMIYLAHPFKTARPHMVSKRKPEQKPFDVDAYVREANAEFRAAGWTRERFEAVVRELAEQPETKQALEEADEVHRRWLAKDRPSAEQRRVGRARRKTS